MSESKQFPGVPRVLYVTFAAAAWAAGLVVVLSLANWPGDWGHSICGPWGCGPPLQTLVACHLAWLVVLVPLSVMLARSERIPPPAVRRLGMLLCIVGVILLVGIVIYQRVVWWPVVGDWQSKFFWQRCGFVVATMVDVPVAQFLLVGAYLVVGAR